VQHSLPPCRPAIAPGTIAERAAIVREGLDDLLLWPEQRRALGFT
jgi:hypothetical protein